MSNIPFNKNICEINIQNNLLVSCIVKINTILPNKFYFSNESKLDIPRIIEIENIDRRTCSYNKDFNNNIILSVRKHKINDDSCMIVPFFKSTNFTCLSCNRIHTQKSEKCCDFENTIIRLNQASLYKIALPNKDQVESYIQKSREEFINLHFPDILDTILLR